jgi:diguanylate cyclase (GGDEF)-like protein
MKHVPFNEPQSAGDLLTHVGVVAQRLVGDLVRSDTEEMRNRALLERALTVAAAAEERLAEQNRRIAFLESLSRTDELTGLNNRRGLVEELRKALARARRTGETGVVIFCDVDSFKAINDAYGHTAGDEVLRTIGQTIAASVREIDTVARLGGDEFAVILANTTRRDGAKRARMLQRDLDNCRHRIGASSVAVRVSLGIEPYGADDDADDLLARADMDMYCNKRRKAATQLRTAAAAE